MSYVRNEASLALVACEDWLARRSRPQVKTRMQLQSKGTGTQYNGMVDCAWSQSGATELAGFRKIIAEEG